VTNQTTNTSITYRQMNGNDLPSAHGLSQVLRWAHRLEDWQFIHRLGTGFVAEEDGALIGTALCWKFGEAHASLGMIIVSPEQQGKGIGRELMNLVLEELGERCILLTATPAGQPLYEKLGFVPTGTLNQQQGTMQQTAPIALAAGESIRPVAAGDLQTLAALATRALGMPREDVMAQVLNVAEGVLIEKDGEALGFSMMRRFGRGHVIGPVVAPDTERAKALIAHWAQTYAGSFVRVDVTGESGLSTWVESLGLVLIEPGVTMVRGQAPVSDDTVKQYAVLNQAIG
jgi:predicted N-acetyltransferase YhbS